MVPRWPEVLGAMQGLDAVSGGAVLELGAGLPVVEVVAGMVGLLVVGMVVAMGMQLTDVVVVDVASDNALVACASCGAM